MLLPFRVALVSAVAIPVTISATFGLLNAFGIELHQVSIAALIVVLGMVVDDAIVIADNYIELLDEGVPRPEAAWRSASELAIPVLTATLTIICSFLPFLILSGATGEFIRALPLTVAIALSTSFLVGMLLTPMLSQFFIKQGLHTHEAATEKKRRSPLEMMQSIYNRVIVVAMRWKTAAIALGILAVAAGAFVLHRLPERFFPFAERDQFVIDVWLPEGWKVEATQAAVARIEDVLRHEKEVVNYTSFIGSSFPRFYYNVNPQLPDKNYAQLLVSTESAEVTPKLVRELRPRLAQAAPEARVFLSELQQGPVQLAPIEVRLSGEDEHVLRYWGDRVLQLVAAHARFARRIQRLARGCLPDESESQRGGGQPSGIHQCHDRASACGRLRRRAGHDLLGRRARYRGHAAVGAGALARASTMSPIPTSCRP